MKAEENEKLLSYSNISIISAVMFTIILIALIQFMPAHYATGISMFVSLVVRYYLAVLRHGWKDYVHVTRILMMLIASLLATYLLYLFNR
jgi:hypothetical protein